MKKNNKKEVHWKLHENIRLNKTCKTCIYGTEASKNYIKEYLPLCTIVEKDEAINDDWFPSICPKILTCINWEDGCGNG